MSTKLPALVPFNDPVTVCGSCLRAACVLGRFVCAMRKSGPVETAAVPLADVRAAAKESPSYWKPQRKYAAQGAEAIATFHADLADALAKYLVVDPDLRVS